MQDFPTSWRTAIIIPVPKPGKACHVVTSVLAILC